MDLCALIPPSSTIVTSSFLSSPVFSLTSAGLGKMQLGLVWGVCILLGRVGLILFELLLPGLGACFQVLMLHNGCKMYCNSTSSPMVSKVTKEE